MKLVLLVSVLIVSVQSDEDSIFTCNANTMFDERMAGVITRKMNPTIGRHTHIHYHTGLPLARQNF